MIYGYHKFERGPAGSPKPRDKYARLTGDVELDLSHMKPTDEVNIDDGNLSAYELGLPVFERARRSVTFFIYIRVVGSPGFITEAHIRDIIRRGHHVGSHTNSHPDLRHITLEEARKEVALGAAQLQDWAGVAVGKFVAPYERYTPDVLEMIRDLKLTPVLNRTAVYNDTDFGNLPARVPLPPEKIEQIARLSGLSVQHVSEFRVEEVNEYLRTLGL